MADCARSCNQEKDFDPLSNKSKQICVSVDQVEYDSILFEPEAFRRYLDSEIELHPELFPVAIQQGYKMYDIPLGSVIFRADFVNPQPVWCKYLPGSLAESGFSAEVRKAA